MPNAPAKTDSELLAAAERAAYSAIEQRRAKEAAKQAIAASWNEVITDINRTLSPSGTVSTNSRTSAPSRSSDSRGGASILKG
ncbi:hypothetical protein [Bradyrhizobium murdochi]|uniref:hypothetical protein n=1 Tax=Bradyrhizobium murdochi TaxID=1038859 RepID=UPI000417C7C7|nr:hypothetical protein [Bradyrhizobium murdochi]